MALNAIHTQTEGSYVSVEEDDGLTYRVSYRLAGGIPQLIGHVAPDQRFVNPVDPAVREDVAGEPVSVTGIDLAPHGKAIICRAAGGDPDLVLTFVEAATVAWACSHR